MEGAERPALGIPFQRGSAVEADATESFRLESGAPEGKSGRGTHDYGLQLVRRGFVTLSIGTPGSFESIGKDTRELLTLPARSSAASR